MFRLLFLEYTLPRSLCPYCPLNCDVECIHLYKSFVCISQAVPYASLILTNSIPFLIDR